MELKNKNFEDISNQILYLINFGQDITEDLKLQLMSRYKLEIDTIRNEGTKKEITKFYSKSFTK
jgi:hypothetical protein